MTKEEKIKDLGFLKEMKDNIDKIANSFNLTNIQHVQTMINDWIDELEEEEPNNGWIKIESEADLPNKKGVYHVIFDSNKNFVNKARYCNINKCFFSLFNRKITGTKTTHYQPIEKPQPPIY